MEVGVTDALVDVVVGVLVVVTSDGVIIVSMIVSLSTSATFSSNNAWKSTAKLLKNDDWDDAYSDTNRENAGSFNNNTSLGSIIRLPLISPNCVLVFPLKVIFCSLYLLAKSSVRMAKLIFKLY